MNPERHLDDPLLVLDRTARKQGPVGEGCWLCDYA